MPKQRSKKILIYFFLFLIIGTLNNRKLNNNDFSKVSEITVSGLDKKNNLELINNLSSLKNHSLFFVNEFKIRKIIDKNKLIDKYFVYKKYPSTLNIKIDKTKFLAQIKKNNDNFILGSNGKLIKVKKYKKNIPNIYGDFKNQNFFELKKAIDQTNFNYNDIKKLFFFQSGRWDIETNKGLLIKLPKDKIKKSLELTIRILSSDYQKKINKIDLRQYNQVIINE
jgi:cell division protein FtsQ